MTALTEQRKMFIDEYLKLRCKNATQAAINAGYSKKSASQQASDLLKIPEVSDYLNDQKRLIESELRQEFIFDATEARKVMYKIMTDDSAENKDRLSAAKDFLDRAGFKAVDRMELSGSLENEKTKLDDLLQQMRGGG
ncbi:MAG: terminase small subunit [Clostridiaceae bacterium]|nr:terminase small subunit [Clostridiaceae bacterium]